MTRPTAGLGDRGTHAAPIPPGVQRMLVGDVGAPLPSRRRTSSTLHVVGDWTP